MQMEINLVQHKLVTNDKIQTSARHTGTIPKKIYPYKCILPQSKKIVQGMPS